MFICLSLVSFTLIKSENKSVLKEMSKFENFDYQKNDMYLPMFPEPINDEIPSGAFLADSRRVLKMLDNFGKIFMPIKYDMEANIEKLTKKFNLDNESHSTLQKMVIKEKCKAENPVATDALLWLKRALNMIQLFFEYIVNDFQFGKSSEDLVACLDKSYEKTLEPYHGYMAQQLFGLLSRMMPTRTQILQAIANGYDVKEEIIIKNMDRFSKRLKENIIILTDFYDENNLDRNCKV